ncbi:tetratricopeptide repeat protein [bacterium]|nr:tetratricopeptide repeat protein [bacterium]
MSCSKSETTLTTATPQVEINALPSTPEQKAQAALAQGKWKEAEQLYKEMIEKSPKNQQLLYNLAVIYDEQHQYAKAKELYEQLLKLDPNDAHSWGGLGWIEFKLNNYHKSLELSQKAIELAPDLVPAWLNIGLANIALERLELAMVAYEKAAFLDKQGRHKNDAINDLNEYLRENATASPLGYFALGYYYKMSGMRSFEKVCFQNFLEQVTNSTFRQKAESFLKEIEEWEKNNPPKLEQPEIKTSPSPDPTSGKS